MQDTDQPVAQRPERLVVAGATGPVGVIAAPRPWGGGQSCEGPQLAGIHQPLIARRPRNHRSAKPRGAGDRRGAGKRLAALSGGVAVRVVAELSQHTRPKHHAKPGQALDDPRVPMDGESEGELMLEGGDLHVEAAEHGDQGATTSR